MAARGVEIPMCSRPESSSATAFSTEEYVALRGHRLLGVGQKQLSLIGELHFRLPLKQLAAAFGFQPRDVAAEILLGEKQTVGGLCKV